MQEHTGSRPSGSAASRLEAARTVYDESAERLVHFTGTEISDGVESRIDQAMLDEFVQRAATSPSSAEGRVAGLDLGCGSGRVAALMARRGLDASGVDFAPGMIAQARLAHPGIRFEVGALDDVPLDDASFGAIALWYSIIATAPRELGAVWSEVARVAEAGASVVVAFQAGSGEEHIRVDAHGTSATLTLFHHDPEQVEQSLMAAGFAVSVSLSRAPELAHETTPQAIILATAP